MTSKVTSKVTSSGTFFRYFWLDSKGRETAVVSTTVKEGHVKAKRREKEAKNAK